MAKAGKRKIKAEYIAGDISLGALSQKYGISLRQLARWSKDEGWVALKKQNVNDTAMKLVDKMSDAVIRASSVRTKNVLDTTDRLLELTKDAMEAGDPEMLRALRSVSGTLKDIKDIYGISTEAEVREQEARIKALQEKVDAAKAEKNDEIIITYEGDASWL